MVLLRLITDGPTDKNPPDSGLRINPADVGLRTTDKSCGLLRLITDGPTDKSSGLLPYG